MPKATQHQQNLGFGHRRLSIIDLAPTSQQPMIDPHLGMESSLVFNGCIYNYRELKSELSAKGYQFFSVVIPKLSSRRITLGVHCA